MLSELIPSISKHLVYSLLEHDYENGVEIINTIKNEYKNFKMKRE